MSALDAVRAGGRSLDRRLDRVSGRALLSGLRAAGAVSEPELAALGPPDSGGWARRLRALAAAKGDRTCRVLLTVLEGLEGPPRPGPFDFYDPQRDAAPAHRSDCPCCRTLPGEEEEEGPGPGEEGPEEEEEGPGQGEEGPEDDEGEPKNEEENPEEDEGGGDEGPDGDEGGDEGPGDDDGGDEGPEDDEGGDEGPDEDDGGDEGPEDDEGGDEGPGDDEGGGGDED